MNDAESIASASPRVLVKEHLALAKPGLTLMSVATALGGAYMAGGPDGAALFHAFAGTLLAGGGALALNQYAEREFDRQMRRTCRRPLPSGTIPPRKALLLGVLLSAAGVLYLLLATTPLAAGLALATTVTYTVLYTPLKRSTPFATVVGAVPGAIPPMIGWASVTGHLDPGAWALFAILFFWQIPHFLALSWVYREDYARAGFRLLAVVDSSGIAVARQMLVYSFMLVPACLLPAFAGLAGGIFVAGSLLASTPLLYQAFRFHREREPLRARRVFLASLFYLPALILLTAVDRIQF